MQYTYEAGEKSVVKIKITLNKEEWVNAQDKAYQKIKGRFSVPGFRKGKVPKHIIVKQYGEGILYEEAINTVFPEHYYAILDKEPTIEPVDRPEIDVENINEEGITMVAIVPVKPEVKIGAYKGIKIDKVEYNVSDKDVEDEIERLRQRNSTETAITDRPAMSGDITIIDYSGSVDGVKFDGGTAEKQQLILGSGQFIPGFEEQVVGMNIGDEKDVLVKFPEDYHAENLKGKDAVFKVKLHEIKIKELPEVNDEFIKDATGTATLEEYKAETKKKMQEANDKKAKYETEDKLIKKIAEDTQVEIPNALVERQIDNICQDMEYRMMYQGLKLEDYLKYTNQTMEAFRENYRKQAEEQVKIQLVIDKIIELEEIKATQEEIDAKIAEQAKASNKDVEEFKKGLNERQIQYYENSVVVEKVFDFLTKNNTID